jgi:hypothetical protein
VTSVSPAQHQLHIDANHSTGAPQGIDTCPTIADDLLSGTDQGIDAYITRPFGQKGRPLMKRRPRAVTVAFPATLVAAIAMVSLGDHAFAVGARPASSPSDITGASIGIPQTWPTSGSGDSWYNTWADDGNIYATSNDSRAFNGTCKSNIVVNEFTGTNPASLASPYANCMMSYGHQADEQNYNDKRTWKAESIISVSGTLYLVVARQGGHDGYHGGYQSAHDASIIKSTNDGRTWSNGFGTTDDPNGAAPPPNPSGTGAESMFPNAFTTPAFINYGRDDNAASTADGGDKYVYAISNDGWAYDGNYLILGRVLRTKIGDLNAANWQFYTGRPGGQGLSSADWSSDVSRATHIVSAVHQLSQSSVNYIRGLRRYVLTNFYYPFSRYWPGSGDSAHSTWAFYQAPHPWGPWTLFYSRPTVECYFSCDQASASPIGLYDPAIVSKFVAMGGLTSIVFTSGDWLTKIRPDDELYRLHEFPLALSTTTATVIDDSAATYTGRWFTSYDSGISYDYTVHSSATAGASATFSFTGDSIAWVGTKNSTHGYARVSVDGGPAVLVDTYAPTRETQHVLYKRGGLGHGKHTITITVTSKKDPAATSTFQDVDAFIVGPG